MSKPDPNEFASAVLWRLAGLEASMILIELEMTNLSAQRQGVDQKAVFERWKEKKQSMRDEFYREAMEAAKIPLEPPPDTPPRQ